MKLIVGLGNPEKEYGGTRHNVGFETIKKLSYDEKIEINRAKFKCHFGEGFIGRDKVILCMPQTYMNLSGEGIRDIMDYYKIPVEDIIIVYDDVSLDPSEIRIRERGSAGGHNGVKNILYQLETDEFVRVKIGIGAKPAKMDLADYVLSKFRKDEEDDIIEGITKAAAAVLCILKDGAKSAMNKFNAKTGVKNEQ